MHLANWWQLAKEDFSTLAPNGNCSRVNLPGVRTELLSSIKEKFVPVGVLDKFQVAGVFVNWWDNIKYDLKTIMQNGWDAGLIPDKYLIEEFFKTEKAEIEKIEFEQADSESQLEEAVEEALNLVEYEPDEEEGEVKQTPKLAKDELAKMIEFYIEEKSKTQKPKSTKSKTSKSKTLKSP